MLVYFGGPEIDFWPDWAIELTSMPKKLPGGCPIGCSYTKDRDRLDEAEASLQFCMSYNPANFVEGKINVIQCTEPFINDDRESLTFSPGIKLKDFDISMTFDPKVSTMPMTFGVWPADPDTFCNVDSWVEEVVKVRTTKSSTRPSCFFAANCNSGRTAYVEEMMKYTEVDSYGPCLHNTGEDSKHTHNSFDLLMERSGSHKFCLAFDKQQTVGYISERLPLAYRSGCLPVYWGSGDVDDYAPGPHSLIKASDFKGPKELSEYLNYLDKNDTAFEEYFAWKTQPLSQVYLD